MFLLYFSYCKVKPQMIQAKLLSDLGNHSVFLKSPNFSLICGGQRLGWLRLEEILAKTLQKDDWQLEDWSYYSNENKKIIPFITEKEFSTWYLNIYMIKEISYLFFSPQK